MQTQALTVHPAVVARRGRLAVVAVALCAMFAQNASAATRLSFYGITNNNPISTNIGETQLFLDVSDTSGGDNLSATQVLFTFRNVGPDYSNISEIYFDDDAGLFASIAYVDDSHPSVDYRLGATPGDLPGGQSASPPFHVTNPYLTEATNPSPHNGVRPGMWVGVAMNLTSGNTLGDVLDDLANGTLRAGIHVTAFYCGSSESFINNPNEPSPGPGDGGDGGPGPGPGGDGGPPGGENPEVPEPVTATLGLLSLGVLGLVSRRRRA